ncbi:sugar phosphate isomerase/epimerase [Parafrigoribacterium mesophilum]|uniref:sugar phosphate isomerase/epimerase family protein n=1 Tax=Parafrigoribacterium mesophilum TaxID=433646 RepID=UPI0031FBC13F
MTRSQPSVQLYTVREALEADLQGTLERIAGMGFTLVEPYNFTAFGGLGSALRAAGLTAPTTHAHFVGRDAGSVFAAARELGIGTVIEPYVEPERWRSLESVRAVAAELGAAAKVGAQHGVRVGYHNHSHELSILLEGRPALEVFADALDDAVMLEVDTYWVAVAGQDPVTVLDNLGGRVQALHIKDGPGTPDTKDQVAVGAGSLAIWDIIASAPDALRVIELDDSRGDRFQAIADSLAFLTTGTAA